MAEPVLDRPRVVAVEQQRLREQLEKALASVE
jgi:hypothetical protein